jgi:hypothetical protein
MPFSRFRRLAYSTDHTVSKHPPLLSALVSKKTKGEEIMNKPTRSRPYRTSKFEGPVSEKKLRFARNAISAIFENSEIIPSLRKITIDLQTGTWTATAILTDKLGKVEPKQSEASSLEAQKASHSIRFEFETK